MGETVGSSSTAADFSAWFEVYLLVLHMVLLERNVARAAERLHVTPSAVSNSLARLRDALGDPLFTRQGRGIVPTPHWASFRTRSTTHHSMR